MPVFDLTTAEWNALAAFSNTSGSYDENGNPWTGTSYKTHMGTLDAAKKKALEAAALAAIAIGY